MKIIFFLNLFLCSDLSTKTKFIHVRPRNDSLDNLDYNLVSRYVNFVHSRLNILQEMINKPGTRLNVQFFCQETQIYDYSQLFIFIFNDRTSDNIYKPDFYALVMYIMDPSKLLKSKSQEKDLTEFNILNIKIILEIMKKNVSKEIFECYFKSEEFTEIENMVKSIFRHENFIYKNYLTFAKSIASDTFTEEIIKYDPFNFDICSIIMNYIKEQRPSKNMKTIVLFVIDSNMFIYKYLSDRALQNKNFTIKNFSEFIDRLGKVIESTQKNVIIDDGNFANICAQYNVKLIFDDSIRFQSLRLRNFILDHLFCLRKKHLRLIKLKLFKIDLEITKCFNSLVIKMNGTMV